MILTIASAGAVWYIGNEPDRRFYQDDIEPDVYAEAYHDLYGKLKSVDPSARVFPGSIVQATELRLKYLDLVLEAYQTKYGTRLPADGWSIHGFILNEQRDEWGAGIPPGLEDNSGMVISPQENDNFDIFVEQIERFRHWMFYRGYRDVPLYLSEYGVLMPKGLFGGDEDFPEGRVNAFMDRTFDYLLNASSEQYGFPPDANRLVQHFSWFSTNSKVFNGYLFDVDNDNERTLMGDNYAAYTTTMTGTVDFFPAKIFVTPSAPLSSSGVVDLTIHAEIANGGNLQVAEEAEVTFFSGHPDEDGRQIGTAETVSLSGCGDTVVAKQVWPDVEPGNYEIYVRVSAMGDTGDIDEANNIGPQYVFFANHRLYIPFFANHRLYVPFVE